MHVQANGLHQRWSSIPSLLQALWHALLVLVLGLVTALVGYLLVLVPWPFVGSLSSLALQVLASQAAALGMQLFWRAPGNPLLLPTDLLVGLIVAMPALAYELLLQARPKLAREKPTYVAGVVTGVWLAFMIGIVLGAVLVVPFALPFIRTIASSRNALPSAVWAPAYFEAVSNLLIWMGLLVELPAAVYAITQTGRRSP